MAIDMFLELNGIKGESRDAKHKDKIDVLGWSWGLSNTGTFHNGSGGGAGRANFKAFTIRKYIDKATCELMYHAACDKRIPKGSLHVRKAGGSPLDYLIFRFNDLTITHVFPELNDERGTETIALNFSKIETEYKTQDAKGLGKAGGMFEWEPKSFELLPKGECPKLPGDEEEKKRWKFLATQYPLALKVAKEYDVDVLLLLAVSAHESGWGAAKSPNYKYTKKNNPFGFTPKGNGTPGTRFSSFESAWAAWGKQFGPRVRGAGSDADAFFQKLLADNRKAKDAPDQRGSYNSEDEDYASETTKCIKDVRRRLPKALAAFSEACKK